MKRIIKAPNLPTKTMKCSYCGCEFTYTKADVLSHDNVLCPCCHNFIKVEGTMRINQKEHLVDNILMSILGIAVFIALLLCLSLLLNQ